MQKLPWERKARIAEVKTQIWSYVSPASRREGPGLVEAAALLGWQVEDVAELARLQFLLSPEVAKLIQELPALSRRLSTTSVQENERSTERIRGPVSWGQTIAGRLASGNPHLHVTTPADRAYQTEENELLVHVLDAVVRHAAASGWDGPKMQSEPATTIRTHLVEGKKWLSSRMLTSVRRLPPTSRSLSRIAAGRAATRYQGVLAAYRKLDLLVERLDLAEIKAAIEENGLVTTQEPILFELLTLFRLIDGLNAHGWQMQPLKLFRGKVQTHGVREDGRRIDLWYQSKTPVLTATSSRYFDVQTQHGLHNIQELRPDLVLHWQTTASHTRILMIECKLSETYGVEHAARRALYDLLAYRQAFGGSLSSADLPYGLGVAWGAQLSPRHNQEVMLCTPDKIEDALLATLA